MSCRELRRVMCARDRSCSAIGARRDGLVWGILPEAGWTKSKSEDLATIMAQDTGLVI
jgi:hypothetical protein